MDLNYKHLKNIYRRIMILNQSVRSWQYFWAIHITLDWCWNRSCTSTMSNILSLTSSIVIIFFFLPCIFLFSFFPMHFYIFIFLIFWHAFFLLWFSKFSSMNFDLYCLFSWFNNCKCFLSIYILHHSCISIACFPRAPIENCCQKRVSINFWNCSKCSLETPKVSSHF